MSEKESVFKGNEVMVMLERMQDGISIIAEEQKSMRTEQKSMREDMNEGFKKVDERFEQVDEKFDAVFEFLSRIEDELVDLRKEINLLKKDKAENADVSNLDGRLTALEEQFEIMKTEKIVA